MRWGDKLLRAVAERLLTTTSLTDLVARFGGDEFVVLLRPATDRGYVAGIARAIIEDLSKPYQIADHQIGIGASIGIAIVSENCVDIGSLLRNADMALYQAKAEGRNTWRFFEAELEIKAQSRRNLEFDLRRAFDKNEFELHFQPIYRVEEVLQLRSPHPLEPSDAGKGAPGGIHAGSGRNGTDTPNG
jgi:predicted signal transduction protein with EAL and GGDEF domain